ncbi:hypothetical protein [Flavobacterium cerinum]|uniref:Uncharacterized protein n=1 Tax=Flavobacterium cerinum TaxID=2502784 RepID=A0ABY5IWV5_9FLAO|nr:hypothetical protein [Flavobacterium cerinum]UUC47308.1 hypothetical protein NOX80_08945 [Flavobacterium cerinum]
MKENYIFFDTKEALTDEEILFILNLCEELLSPPTIAYINQTKEVIERPVTSYLDKETLKAFSRNKYGIEYQSEAEKPSIRITKSAGSGLICIPLVEKDKYHLTKKMALKLVEGINLKGLSVSPVDFYSYRDRYRINSRTYDFPGLYWLQYYDAEEFKKQGGKAILDNPYIDAQLIKDGIFIQVGETPYDFQTPEGEDRMTKANAAMPPVVNE